MPSVTSVISYLFLFFALCIGIVIIIALWNIFSKGYNPRHAMLIVGFLLIMFIVSAIFSLSSANRAMSLLRGNSTSQNNTTNDPVPTNNGDNLY